MPERPGRDGMRLCIATSRYPRAGETFVMRHVDELAGGRQPFLPFDDPGAAMILLYDLFEPLRYRDRVASVEAAGFVPRVQRANQGLLSARRRKTRVPIDSARL